MKRSIILIVVLISSFNLKSANPANNNGLGLSGVNEYSTTVLRLNFLFPSAEIETRTFYSNTFVIKYNPGFFWRKNNNEPTEFRMVSQVNGSLRHYYNLEKRSRQGKTLKKFSGNYISLYANYAFETDITNSYALVGPTWGIQRNYGKAFHLGVELGVGVIFRNEPIDMPITLIADFKLGFSIDFARN